MKKMTLQEITTRAKPDFDHLLFGWLCNRAAGGDKMAEKFILDCANFNTLIGNEVFDNERYFNPEQVPAQKGAQ